VVLGIGIDIARVDRFLPWLTFSDARLARVFTHTEIAELRTRQEKRGDQAATQFLASRFAAKEAFFKALCQAMQAPLHLFDVCRYLELAVSRQTGVTAHVDWKKIAPAMVNKVPEGPVPDVKISLSHEQCHAVAVAVLTKS
jgi:phosphopantetheine--protein transferase-like protein